MVPGDGPRIFVIDGMVQQASMGRSLKRIALVVTYGTLLSKAGGLIRQLVIAAAFGVGAAYDAYNYAYILPGFLLILLGGINGPFHSAMVSVLSRRPREEGAHILATLNTTVSALLLVVTAVLVLAADPLITLVGPGLSSDLHQIAVAQLQVMAPMALLAGLIGLGFGSLNAADEFWIPAISPLMSSVALVLGVGLLWWQLGAEIALPVNALWGGVVLALSTLVGALLQWLLQLPALARQGMARLRLSWDWSHPGVREVWRVMGPATLSSGMLQINVFTDMFFCFRHPWCGSRPELLESVGPDPIGPDLQCSAGAIAAHVLQTHSSRRSAAADRQDPAGTDAVDRFDAAAWSLVSGSVDAHRRPCL